MATVFDCSVSTDLLAGMRNARGAISRGELVVFPTDTVYGIAADAFSPAAVQRLLDAKGRTRQSPPPVLVSSPAMLGALVDGINPPVHALTEEFWPGALTIVLNVQPSLAWDLGETGGSVAVRMPDNELALELLTETGPLAVSSANLTGNPPALTAEDALEMLGDSVEVYLDGGESAVGGTASTIVDARGLTEEGGELIVLRHGDISIEDLARVVPLATVR